MAAWKAWVEKNRGAIVDQGAPLGKTKQVTSKGIADIRNNMGAYTVVQADSQEAAAKLFENHPHFTMFPGEGVEDGVFADAGGRVGSASVASCKCAAPVGWADKPSVVAALVPER